MRTASGSPIIGAEYLLYSILAPELGGTLMRGGRVNVPGVLGGAFLIILVSNILGIMGVVIYWKKAAIGLIFIIALAFSSLVERFGGGRRVA